MTAVPHGSNDLGEGKVRSSKDSITLEVNNPQKVNESFVYWSLGMSQFHSVLRVLDGDNYIAEEFIHSTPISSIMLSRFDVYAREVLFLAQTQEKIIKLDIEGIGFSACKLVEVKYI